MTEICFIGTSTCIPDLGSEVASFVIEGKHLVDTGWGSVLRMREYALEPLKLETVILTHFHQDHYLGLPQLLFYLGLKKAEGLYDKSLTVVGPAEYLETVMNLAQEFLQLARFPQLSLDLNLVPLVPGDKYETPEFRLATFPGKHVSGPQMPEEALVCRFTCLATGSTFSFTGDTSYHPPISEFVRGTSVLIHDVCHSSAVEAAKIAQSGEINQLYLIHYPAVKKDRLLKEARSIFPHSWLATEGETIKVS